MKINEFRAWDKENEVMVYSDKSFPLSEYRFGIDLIYGEGLTLTKLSDRINVIYEDGEEGFSNDFEKVDSVMMQYTGLKDKNGTKIYEGDLLVDTNDLEEIGKVIFDEGCFQVQWDGIVENLFENCDVYDVIGNKYENSNLLEDKR